MADSSEVKNNRESYRSAISGYRKAYCILNKLNDSSSDYELEKYTWAAFLLYERFNEKNSLENAIEELEMRIAVLDPYLQPHTWGRLKLLLGTVYSNLAETASTTEQANLAEKHFSDALTVIERQGAPDLWRHLQHNFGVVLLNMSRKTMSQSTCQKAISAFKSATPIETQFLCEETAKINLNLGNAFQVLYELTSNLQHCYTAQSYHKKNLKIFTLEASPYEYFVSRISLGEILRQIGQVKGSQRKLKIAFRFMKQVFKSSSLSQYPVLKAKLENNLSNALQDLGRINNDINMFQQAYEFVNSAAQSVSKINSPLEWGMHQYNKGNSALLLAEKNKKYELIQEAIIAYDSALTIVNLENAPTYWGMIQSQLGRAYGLLAEIRNDALSFQQYIDCILQTFKVYSREISPALWAKSCNELGAAYKKFSIKYKDISVLKKAIEYLNNSLTVFKPNNFPVEWEISQNHLAEGLMHFAGMTNTVDTFAKAINEYRILVMELKTDSIYNDKFLIFHNLGYCLLQMGKSTRNIHLLKEAEELFRYILDSLSIESEGFYEKTATANLEDTQKSIILLS